MANHNIQRLNEDVKREISVALRDIKDEKISGGIVSISHVEITNDLSYCKVYVSCLEGGERTEQAAKTLQKAEGFFKKRINSRIKMRKIPELIFLPDNSQDYYDKINKILSELNETHQEEPEPENG